MENTENLEEQRRQNSNAENELDQDNANPQSNPNRDNDEAGSNPSGGSQLGLDSDEFDEMGGENEESDLGTQKQPPTDADVENLDNEDADDQIRGSDADYYRGNDLDTDLEDEEDEDEE